MAGWWFQTCFVFPYAGHNHPNWLSYFSEGLKPPTTMVLTGILFGDLTKKHGIWMECDWKSLEISWGHIHEQSGCLINSSDVLTIVANIMAIFHWDFYYTDTKNYIWFLGFLKVGDTRKWQCHISLHMGRYAGFSEYRVSSNISMFPYFQLFSYVHFPMFPIIFPYFSIFSSLDSQFWGIQPMATIGNPCPSGCL